MDGKTAFSSWNERIAPVFDVARHAVVVEIASGRIAGESRIELPGDEVAVKAEKLAELRVSTLVCGGISRFVYNLVVSYGIRVVPFVAGDLREVIGAWADGRLGDEFAMPGCCGRVRRKSGNRRRAIEPAPVSPQRYSGLQTPGPLNGLLEGNNGGPDLDQPFSQGLEGMCVCPRCGHQEPHKNGIPCLHMQCPICFSMMIRGS